MSLFIIVQSIQLHDPLFGLFGSFFLYQALTNTGCCGVKGCAPAVNKNDTSEEIEFTEVKNK